MKYRVPFYQLQNSHQALKEELRNAFEQTLERGSFILGKALETFEKSYAEKMGVNYAVGLSNGLDALKIALRCLGIGRGDEVIVPAHTFVATVQAVCTVGAKPILVEPNMHTYTLDTDLLSQQFSKRTKAVLLVHLYGQPADIATVKYFCKTHNLFLIEDNAQAHLAQYQGQATGSFGDISAASFYPTKNLGALGDAGVITSNNLELTEMARSLRNYGSAQKYHYEYIGYNARLDELQAALLQVKLEYLERWNAERRQLAHNYSARLRGITDIKLPEVLPDTLPVFHLFVIRTQARDALQKFLEEKGIQTQIHYPKPIHLQTAYQHLNYPKGSLPITEHLAQTCLSLPLFIGMTSAQQDYVIAQIRTFFGE